MHYVLFTGKEKYKKYTLKRKWHSLCCFFGSGGGYPPILHCTGVSSTLCFRDVLV